MDEVRTAGRGWLKPGLERRKEFSEVDEDRGLSISGRQSSHENGPNFRF